MNMSEKRFVQCEIEYGFKNTTNVKKIGCIRDMYKEKTYGFEQIVGVLNEQDNELDKYRTENAELHITILEIEKKVGEQQATINELEKNFDDLVNWASEISKRNVVLDEQIGELQRENEQLKIDLESLETTSDATSDYNAHLESKITTLEKENEQLRKEHQEMLEKYVLLKLKIGEVLNDE